MGLTAAEYLPFGGGRPVSRRAARDGTLIITPVGVSGGEMISGRRARRSERLDGLGIMTRLLVLGYE